MPRQKQPAVELLTVDQVSLLLLLLHLLLILLLPPIPSQVLGDLSKSLGRVSEILPLPGPVLRALMYHAKWDSQVLLLLLAFLIILLLAQVLLESFFSDPDLVYKKAGVTDPDLLLPVEEQQVCGICYDDLPPASLVAAHCGHSSCPSCWREHVTTRLEAGRALTLDCPACPALLQEDLVAKVL